MPERFAVEEICRIGKFTNIAPPEVASKKIIVVVIVQQGGLILSTKNPPKQLIFQNI